MAGLIICATELQVPFPPLLLPIIPDLGFSVLGASSVLYIIAVSLADFLTLSGEGGGVVRLGLYIGCCSERKDTTQGSNGAASRLLTRPPSPPSI